MARKSPTAGNPIPDEELRVVMRFERATKNMIRYVEDQPEHGPPMLGALYLRKDALRPMPTVLVVWCWGTE